MLAAAHASWNLVDDVRQLFEFPFMVNAFRAGTIVAVVAGAIGWFMVIRRQAFAGHTLALVGFPGAAGAVWLGVSAAWGFFGFCLAAALLIAALRPEGGDRYGEESAGIGVVQAFALASGFLFISLYRGFLNGINALLFGSFLGITTEQVVVLLIVGVVALVALGVVSRPLLFASVDPDVAAARGVRVRSLSVLFLVLLGLTVAEVSQITGTLLVFALLVMPAATAQQLTARPAVSAAVTVAIGLAVTWLGLAVAYFTPYPIGFFVTTFAFAAYLAAAVVAAYELAANKGDGDVTNAVLAGTAIAVAAGLVGYFMVLRGQVFTGDALSHVSVTGALAALAFGIDARLGLFAATIAVGAGIALLGLRGRADDVVIGSVFAWVLGLGVLFLSLYTTSRSSGNGAAGVSVLFGSILSLNATRAYVAVAVAGGIVLCLLVIARPLLFASVDDAVAAARGVRVRALDVAFLVLVGACAAEATQAVGALLLLGLLAAPAGAAIRLTARPYRGLVLSGAFGVLAMWVGLAVSHAAPRVPPSFAIIGVASAVYALTFLARPRRRGSSASM